MFAEYLIVPGPGSAGAAVVDGADRAPVSATDIAAGATARAQANRDAHQGRPKGARLVS